MGTLRCTSRRSETTCRRCSVCWLMVLTQMARVKVRESLEAVLLMADPGCARLRLFIEQVLDALAWLITLLLYSRISLR